MKSLASRLSLLFTTVALTSCSSVRVATDYDRAAAFDAFRTYALAPTPRGEGLTPSGEAALCATLRSTLAGRGIVPASGSEGDLLVVRHLFSGDDQGAARSEDWGYELWPGARRTTADLNPGVEGTLVLDFVDARTHRVVFRGRASGVVGGPDGNEAKVRTAVRRIVARLPR